MNTDKTQKIRLLVVAFLILFTVLAYWSFSCPVIWSRFGNPIFNTILVDVFVLCLFLLGTLLNRRLLVSLILVLLLLSFLIKVDYLVSPLIMSLNQFILFVFIVFVPISGKIFGEYIHFKIRHQTLLSVLLLIILTSLLFTESIITLFFGPRFSLEYNPITVVGFQGFKLQLENTELKSNGNFKSTFINIQDINVTIINASIIDTMSASHCTVVSTFPITVKSRESFKLDARECRYKESRVYDMCEIILTNIHGLELRQKSEEVWELDIHIDYKIIYPDGKIIYSNSTGKIRGGYIK